jgi:hypothetical protein
MPLRAWIAVSLALGMPLCTGCVNRRMTIRTNPPGALVEIDGERKGLSPVSTDFTYYGTHEITMSAPGYETLTVQQKVQTPWYQQVPVDFFSNHFLLGDVTDRRDFSFQLQPKRVMLDEETQLHDRANNFRSQSQSGTVTRP